ncbi:hypothetical protein [Paeniglutamicibacter sp. NPDC091659]|uniref:hypothetical protein n=1 Tax=Paeniglutamicibacter sp. NPDC091659 TaxID=3364389 RepID=UPI00382771F4
MKVTVDLQEFIESQPLDDPLGRFMIFFGTVYYVKDYETNSIDDTVTFNLLTPEQYVRGEHDIRVLPHGNQVMTLRQLNEKTHNRGLFARRKKS